MARLTLIAALLLSAAAHAEEELKPRFSVALGAGGIFPSTENQYIAQSAQLAINLEATVELDWLLLGAVALAGGLGETSLPSQAFFGAKIGIVPSSRPVAPYFAFSVGRLTQSALFPFDEGTPGQGSGAGYMPEAGLVFGRKRGLGRLWMFVYGLFPSFTARTIENFPGEARISSWGLGLRLGL
jgi:hypothetical protein